MYERRLRNRKIRRQRELQAHITIFTITAFLIIVLAILFGSILSRAQSKENIETSYKYYTSILIQSGDTLGSIANEYMDEQYYSEKSYINEVININYLQDNDITAGQHIIVPYYSNEFKG